jgi:bacteriocin biosynthesis cyclodehydratase domain-containing protein
MKLDIEDLETRYRLLPAQIVAIEGGAIVRRGTTQLKIGGTGALETVERVAQIATRPGGATVDELCDAFALDARDQVRALVERMTSRRLLVEAVVPDSPPSGPRDEDALDVFLWQGGADERARKRVAERHVAIVGVNEVSRRLVPALRACGYERLTLLDHELLRNPATLQTSAERLAWTALALPEPESYESWAARDVPVDVLVAASDFGGLAAMREWNAYCVSAGIAFFPVVLQDLVGYVGPLVIPRESPCFECLWARQNSHLEPDARDRRSELVACYGQAVVARIEPMASILGDVAAMELLKHDAALGGTPGPIGRAIEVSLLEPEMTSRKILKVPRCAVCSPLATAAARSPERDVFMPGHGE